MAPAAVSPGVQDVDLTSSAIERKLDALPVKNGSAVGVSADANGKKVSQPAELDASKLVFTRNTNPRAVPSEAVANSGTQTICTDHMITATWNATTGWAAPELKAYGPLSLMPTASSQLGVQAPSEAMLYIIVSFMPRMDSPPGGMRLHTSPEDQVRAWVGGFGYAKVGANYGPSLAATVEARKRGFGQILWLYGEDQLCTEAGASNFFVAWKSKQDPSKIELVTAPLDDRLILDGVNRRSVVALARERLAGQVDVVERKYSIDEVIEADAEGRLLESFATGTAYFVCPISLIHHRGKDINIGMGSGEGGELTLKLKGYMCDIMYGGEEHEWAVTVQEEQ
ncbi:Branched-chain-amino-acid aminotransferase like protein [Verticillium longisporum]|uniref:Branched-chain-amino-acid aminotransferase like protein n=1 Tax=Verticillium longisporum TaxID=100787 RepID=A0A8I2ZH85_VERLO|nr:Branched-chain-amino-acid aminotransferase like protein [Verticillium longisporum]